MFRTAIIVALVLGATPIHAQQKDDCIENITGKTVCGADAEAVRARIRAEARYAQNPEKPLPKKSTASGSIYDSFRPAVFVRGGYTFAADANRGLEAEGGGPSVFAGYRSPIWMQGNNAFSVETELGLQRAPREDMLASVDGYGALIALRWDHAFNQNFGMFASGGVGIAYLRAYVLDVFVEDEVTFGYNGRGGIRANLSRALSLEAAYRYTGAMGVDFGLPVGVRLGSHTGEIGLDIRF